MVSAIRNIELAMSGSGIKEPTESEKKNIVVGRRSIVAATFIAKGEVFTPQNLTTKRPGNGISPMLWDEVIGKTARKDFQPNEPIELL
jgi:N,N'-diacetyllegionaminate synthase